MIKEFYFKGYGFAPDEIISGPQPDFGFKETRKGDEEDVVPVRRFGHCQKFRLPDRENIIDRKKKSTA